MLKLRASALLVVVLSVAACAGATAPPSPSPAPPSATPNPTPTAVPGDPGSGTGGIPVNPIPDPNANPLFGDATYVKPTAGRLNPHPVSVQLVRAQINPDGTVTADLRWWSGVAPCSELDHVEMVTDEAAKTIHLKVIEGAGAADVACIDIAQLTATAVDLGKLASGSWKISAEGEAPGITLDVP